MLPSHHRAVMTELLILKMEVKREEKRRVVGGRSL